MHTIICHDRQVKISAQEKPPKKRGLGKVYAEEIKIIKLT